MNDNIDAYITRYNGFIQMLPNETFLQITNCESDIAFGGFITVELINSCQEVVTTLQVGENFFYTEFSDIKGINQIAYEFGNIAEDFYQDLLFLKLTHTISGTVWFSNGFFITEELKEETTRFEYKNNSYFKGISYDKVSIFQSIRLTCFKNDIDYNIESEEYTQISGAVISLRPIITPIEKYLFYTCDYFTFNRLVTLLNHDLIYINGYKISNKPKPTKSERVVDTNFFDVNFDANPTEDFRAFQYQIYEPLQVISRVLPNESVNTSSNGLFSLTFNKNINLVSGITAKLYENGTLVSTVTPTASTNILSLDFSSYTFTNATYTIVIEPNKVYHSIENWNGYAFGEWNFTINTKQLTITNVVATPLIGANNFDIVFNSNFTLTQIKAQVSIDGINWSTPTTAPNTNSPYNRIISIGGSFYVRIYDNATNIIYSNIYYKS